MQKLNNAVIVFCLALSTISNAAQTTPDKIQSFAKKHETKIAVIAAAVAGTGLGSYITYYFTARRNKAMKEYYDAALAKNGVNTATETTKAETQNSLYKNKLAQLLKSEFEKYFKNSFIVKHVGKWEVTEVELRDDGGFKIQLNMEHNVLRSDYAEQCKAVFNDWPLWKYQSTASIHSLIITAYDDSFSCGFSYYDQVFTCKNNGWQYVPRA